jgi:hypothetical protein
MDNVLRLTILILLYRIRTNDVTEYRTADHPFFSLFQTGRKITKEKKKNIIINMIYILEGQFIHHLSINNVEAVQKPRAGRISQSPCWL